MRSVVALTVLLALLLPVRLPGQYGRRRGPSSATATASPYGGPAVTFNGTVKTLTKKEMTLDLDPPDPGADRQTLTFRLTKKTKYQKGDEAIKPTDIEVGMHLSLDATRDGDLKLSAVNVVLGPAAKPGDKPAESVGK